VQQVFAAVAMLLVQLPASMQLELRRRLNEGSALLQRHVPPHTRHPLPPRRPHPTIDEAVHSVLHPQRPPPSLGATVDVGAAARQRGRPENVNPSRGGASGRSKSKGKSGPRSTLPQGVVDLLRLPPSVVDTSPRPHADIPPRGLSMERMGGGFKGPASATATTQLGDSPRPTTSGVGARQRLGISSTRQVYSRSREGGKARRPTTARARVTGHSGGGGGAPSFHPPHRLTTVEPPPQPFTSWELEHIHAPRSYDHDRGHASQNTTTATAATTTPAPGTSIARARTHVDQPDRVVIRRPRALRNGASRRRPHTASSTTRPYTAAPVRSTQPEAVMQYLPSASPRHTSPVDAEAPALLDPRPASTPPRAATVKPEGGGAVPPTTHPRTGAILPLRHGVPPRPPRGTYHPRQGAAWTSAAKGGARGDPHVTAGVGTGMDTHMMVPPSGRALVPSPVSIQSQRVRPPLGGGVVSLQGRTLHPIASEKLPTARASSDAAAMLPTATPADGTAAAAAAAAATAGATRSYTPEEYLRARGGTLHGTEGGMDGLQDVLGLFKEGAPTADAGSGARARAGAQPTAEVHADVGEAVPTTTDAHVLDAQSEGRVPASVVLDPSVGNQSPVFGAQQRASVARRHTKRSQATAIPEGSTGVEEAGTHTRTHTRTRPRPRTRTRTGTHTHTHTRQGHNAEAFPWGQTSQDVNLALGPQDAKRRQHLASRRSEARRRRPQSASLTRRKSGAGPSVATIPSRHHVRGPSASDLSLAIAANTSSDGRVRGVGEGRFGDDFSSAYGSIPGAMSPMRLHQEFGGSSADGGGSGRPVGHRSGGAVAGFDEASPRAHTPRAAAALVPRKPKARFAARRARPQSAVHRRRRSFPKKGPPPQTYAYADYNEMAF